MKDMSLNFRADRLDVAGLARANGTIQGNTLLQKFERLRTESCRPESESRDSHSVHWQATGEWVETVGAAPQTWLHLQVQAKLTQICQRCMTEVDTPIEVTRSYRFVADEATAEALDDSCDEDLLAISREFDLLELIEDEMLMDLPLVPMHNICPVAPKMAAIDSDFESKNQQKPNPFAVLQSLKGNDPKQK